MKIKNMIIAKNLMKLGMEIMRFDGAVRYSLEDEFGEKVKRTGKTRNETKQQLNKLNDNINEILSSLSREDFLEVLSMLEKATSRFMSDKTKEDVIKVSVCDFVYRKAITMIACLLRNKVKRVLELVNNEGSKSYISKERNELKESIDLIISNCSSASLRMVETELEESQGDYWDSPTYILTHWIELEIGKKTKPRVLKL